MGHDESSLDLLAHFDRPKTVICPDFEWEAGDERIESAHEGFVLVEQPASEPQSTTKRGIRWVLQWALALAVLTVAASVLTEFAYLLAAEHRLTLAARAGATEATLPRATYQSVTSAIERRLTDYPLLARQLQFTLAQNGSPMPRQIRQNDGDRFSITLVASNSAVVPGWLRTMMFWRSESQLQVHSERQMPARKLTPRRMST